MFYPRKAYVIPTTMSQRTLDSLLARIGEMHEMLAETLERSVRTETRLVKLMAEHGLDHNGKPLDL